MSGWWNTNNNGTGFDDTFYYFGNERQIRDWPIVREFFFVQCWFLKQWWDNGFLESGVKLAGDEGKVDNIGDCGNKNWWALWVTLLVWTVGQDLVDFGFWGRGEDWKIRGSGRRRGWVWRWCGRVAGERKAEFGYFATERRSKAVCKWSARRGGGKRWEGFAV